MRGGENYNILTHVCNPLFLLNITHIYMYERYHSESLSWAYCMRFSTGWSGFQRQKIALYEPRAYVILIIVITHELVDHKSFEMIRLLQTTISLYATRFWQCQVFMTFRQSDLEDYYSICNFCCFC